MYKTRLAASRKQLDAVIATDLANFNKMLKDKNVSTVISAGQ